MRASVYGCPYFNGTGLIMEMTLIMEETFSDTTMIFVRYRIQLK